MLLTGLLEEQAVYIAYADLKKWKCLSNSFL